MDTTPGPFDLQILAGGDCLWVSATSRLGSVLALPVTDEAVAAFTQTMTTIEWFRTAVAEGRRTAPPAGALALVNAPLAIDEVGALLRRTRGAAAAVSRPVLVRLFAAPDDVAALPWELMADPEQPEQPLALAPDVLLARIAQIRTYALREQPISPPINVLLVLSNPIPVNGEQAGEEPLFDHYEERRHLLAELQPLVDRGLLSVTVEDRPCLDRLRRRLGAEPRGFHVVHFLGHARARYLKLENADGRPTWVPSEQVAELLRRSCPDLRLVVLAGCQTAVSVEGGVGPSARRAGASITDGVAQVACPSVVGMQAVLPFRTEQLFARAFYQSLCAGRSIAQAVNQARVSILSDDIVGGGLLDWAVPILVTGDTAGPVVDLAQTALPPPPPRELHQLKLGLDEPDREFFARFVELRTVLDVLAGVRGERVAVITGDAGVGKTRLVDRALDDLEGDVECVLYTPGSRLERGDPAAALETLCRLVAELLGRTQAVPERDPAWTAGDWWDRLVEELVDRRLVMVIEDVDRLAPEAVGPITDAICSLVQRRSRCRVVLTARKYPHHLLAPIARYAVPVGLQPLTEDHVEQWVRRNRPGLATVLRQHPKLLVPLFRSKLSSRLELWAALAAEVDQRLRTGALLDDTEILSIADRLRSEAEPEPPPTATQSVVPRSTSEAATAASGPVEDRAGPLQIIAGFPQRMAPGETLAGIIAAEAARYGVAGRFTTAAEPDQPTAIATLVYAGSPFDEHGEAEAGEVTSWLEAVAEHPPHILLLDFGGDSPAAADTRVLQRMAEAGTLLIAAGGHGAEPTYPAHDRNVLAVGALGDDGRPRPFSPWFARRGKPDIYARDNLADSPLSAMLPGTEPAVGTSSAALRVLVAAVLVWSVDRSRTAAEVRALLIGSARPVAVAKGRRQPCQLDEAAALTAARGVVVANSLQLRPLDEQALAVATGLDRGMVSAVLTDLESRQLVAWSGERAELSPQAKGLEGGLALAEAVSRPDGADGGAMGTAAVDPAVTSG